MRSAIATILLLGTSLSFAQDNSNVWEAKVHQSGCVATLHFLKAFPFGNGDENDPLGNIYFTFFRPSSDYEGNEFESLDSGEPQLGMLIQPWLYFTSQDKGITFSNPIVRTTSRSFEVPPAEHLKDPSIPGFSLVGNPALEIWGKIVSKQPVSIEIKLSTGNQYSVDVEGDFLDEVSRMFTACAGVISHNNAFKSAPSGPDALAGAP